MKIHYRRLLPTLLSAVAFLSAQDTSSLRGTVTDPTGAIIPGVALTLIDPSTQSQRTAQSSTEGVYQFPQIQPGSYELKAEAEGFATVLVTGVVVEVGKPASLPIQFVELDTVAETVAVSAEAVMLNTVDASIGHTMGQRQVLQLPFNARNVVNMLSLQPGVTFVGDTDNLREDRRAGTINGSRSDQSNITLDGVDVNDQQERYAFTAVLRSTLDSVQEFRVTTLNPDASQGRSSGAQVQLVTKSGTNEIHGSLYEFHRNTATAAAGFFNNSSGIGREKLIRNVFGGSVGGPIVKDRVFYFFNAELRRDASEGTASREVPTAEMRQGVIRYLREDGSTAILNQDDVRRIDPLGIGANPAALDALNKYYPLPNDSTLGDGLNVQGFRFTYPVADDRETYISKWDFKLDRNANHSLFVRGQLQSDKRNEDPQFPGQEPQRVELDNSKGVAIGYDAVLSPNLISSTRFGYTRQGNELTGVQNSSVVEFRGLDDPLALTNGISRILPVYTLGEDMTWIRGRHSLRFGGVYRNVQNRRTDAQNSFHRLNINSSWLLDTGAELLPDDIDSNFSVAYRDALLGVLGVVSFGEARYRYDVDGNVLPQGSPIFRNFLNEELELYATDTWQPTRNLTLTYGLRWSLMPPVREKNGVQTSPNIPLAEWLGARAALAEKGLSQTGAGVIEWDLAERTGRGLYPYHKTNFAPRLALTYSPSKSGGALGKLLGGPGKTVIRAGGGMFYDIFGQGMMRRFSASALGFSTQIANPSGELTTETAPRMTGLFDIPGELILPAPPGGFPQRQPDAFQITNAIDDSIVPPYSIALNLSIGREFGRGFFLETSYVGRLTRRTIGQADLAMPTNLRDPDSGQTYFQAAEILARQVNAGVPIEEVAPVPFWENMWPDAAGDGLTATQGVYNRFNLVAPDWSFALFRLDRSCRPACSRLGRAAMFNDQYSALAGWRNIGSGNYHSGQLTLRKRFSQGFQFDLNYTLSKSIDLYSHSENSGDFDGFVINTWAPEQMRGVSDYDMLHQFNANWVVELPFGQDKPFGNKMGPVADAILGGWQISGLFRQTSGLPAEVSNGRQWPTNWNVEGEATQVAELRTATGAFKNAPAVTGDGGPNIFADPRVALDAFGATLPGQSGSRNPIRGDGFFTVDLGLGKRFRMPWENHSLQLRWEIFNVTNSTRFDPQLDSQANETSISLDLTSSGTFGKYSNTLTNPRVMQFALRYEW